MSTPDARVRGLSYSGLYYEAALQGIESAAAIFLPWHTEQDPHDPINGMKRVVAYMAHRDGSLLDRLGSGLFWTSFLTRAEAIALAAQIGYRLERDRPSSATLVGKLQLDVVGVETIVPEGAQFLAPGDGQTPGVTFEALDALVSVETDFRGFDVDNGSGGVVKYVAISGLFVEFDPNDANFSIWATGALSDACYFGHPTLAFTAIDLTFSATVDRDNVWELYDPSYQFAPGPDEADDDAAVYDLGDGRLRFRLEDYAAGARLDDGAFSVTVTCLLTGRAEVLEVTHDGARGAIVTSDTLFGQDESPSTEPADYTVKPGWVVPLELDDGTDGCTQTGRVSWRLPVTYRYQGEIVERKWAKTTVGGQEAYWLRNRRTGAAAGSFSVIAAGGVEPVSAEDGAWWAIFDVVQGTSESVDAGESTGAPFQRFEVPVDDLIEGSLRIFVVPPGAPEGVEWTLVPTLYATEPTDYAATLVEEPDGRLFVVFGDGQTNGAIPTEDETIRFFYRRGAARNGDVGVESIRLAIDGAIALSELSNPRGATGWAGREGGTELDLERVRLSVPATVRIGTRIVTHEDASFYAQRWQTTGGRRPVARAEAADSLEAPDGMDVFTLGSDGYPLAETDRAALEVELNGRRMGLQRIGGLVAANVVAYVRAIRVKTISLTVTVYVLPGYSAGVEAAVKANLRAYLHPLAVKGTVIDNPAPFPRGTTFARGSAATWQHRLGASVSRYAIGAVARDASGSGFADASVTFALGGAAVALANDELPIAGTINVSVVEVE